MGIIEGRKDEKDPLDAVILRGGEAVRETWSARAQVISNIGVNSQPVKTSVALTVLFTNLRLIAIRGTGVFSSNYDLFAEMDLESISGMSLRDILLHTFVIINYRAQGGTAELALFSIEDGVDADKEPPTNPFRPADDQATTRFMASLDKAVRTRLREVELEKKRERTVFDFSALRDQMANGGIIVTTVKCPNCGANLDLPEKGDSVRCEYCGSRIQAVDLLQKLKELLAG